MSTPRPPFEPPAAGDERPDEPSRADAGRRDGEGAPNAGGARPTYDFHGEQLDFDPYRFGAPETPAAPWSPPVAGPPAVAPGERWNGGATGGSGGPDAPPAYRPGDYWGGGGGQRPPSGAPQPGPPPGPGPSGATPPGGSPYSGYGGYGTPTHGAPPPPYGSPYPPPGYGAYPAGRGADGGPRPGNGVAVGGFAVGLASLLLFILNWVAVFIGLVGLVLSVIGLTRARSKGAPHRLLALWGIGLSVLGILAGIAVIVWLLSNYDLTCLSNRGVGGDYSSCRT